jgi:hypothetical protein
VHPAEVVHHVEPHEGDKTKFYLGKLESLCRSCHERHHDRAPRPFIGVDGWPVSPGEQAWREAVERIKREAIDDDESE